MAEGTSLRPRVAINAAFWGQETAGSGQYLHHLTAALAVLPDGPEVVLCGPPALQAAYPLPEGVHWHDIPIPGPLQGRENLAKVWLEQVGFPRAARSAGAQLAQVPYFGPPLHAPLPTVVTIHDLIPLLLPAYRTSPRVRLYMALAARAARRATLVLTDAGSTARQIVAHLGIPPERVRTIPLAPAPAFQALPTAEALRRARERFGLPERYFLYLGGFDTRKNLATLFRALAEARRKDPDVPLLVVAGALPPAPSDLIPDPRRQAEEAGVPEGVRFLGRVAEADKPALYGGAVAFLFPSQYEGFGLPVLEALACGTAVACGDGSSLPEVAGPGALLLPPSDVSAWALALLRLAQDGALCARLRARGRAHAAAFTWERTARATAAAYRDALALQGGHAP